MERQPQEQQQEEKTPTIVDISRHIFSEPVGHVKLLLYLQIYFVLILFPDLLPLRGLIDCTLPAANKPVPAGIYIKKRAKTQLIVFIDKIYNIVNMTIIVILSF
jgi:hypothetical protein